MIAFPPALLLGVSALRRPDQKPAFVCVYVCVYSFTSPAILFNYIL